MAFIRFILGFFSPPALIVAVLLIADGVKGEPVDLSQAAQGCVLFALALLVFPRPGHPLHDLIDRFSSSSRKPQASVPEPARNRSSQKPQAQVAAPDPKELLSPEQAKMLTEMIEYNVDALTFEPVPRPWHAGWCRLDPVIGSSKDATSWIGGVPELPPEVDWPEENGNPAIFVAQIALADLPANVWDGLFPRNGWLVFFIAPDVVLHVDRKGPPRPHPDGWQPEHIYPSDMTWVHKALGRDPAQTDPFKWALQVTPLAPDAPEPPHYRDRERADTDPRKALAEIELTEAPFCPDSPERIDVLLGAVEAHLKQGRSWAPKFELEAGAAFVPRFETAFTELEQLRQRSRTGIAPETLLAEVDRITDGDADPEAGRHPLINVRSWLITYRNAVEYLARETYLDDPARLDPSARAVFEPVWRFDAGYEAATISGPVSQGYTYAVMEEPVLLLQLLPSELTGWIIGDIDIFGFFIKPDDLKAGRWDKAWGDIVN